MKKEKTTVFEILKRVYYLSTKRTTGLCENKKSGKLSQNEMDSALVGNEGLEPPTSSL